MAKPFKFRYVNEIVGGFVLLVLALLLIAIALAGHAQGWFEPKLTVRAAFPREGPAGIQRGSKVMVLGYEVGAVHDVEVSEEGDITGVLLLKGPFIRFIRDDSEAIIKKQFAVAGDAFIEITKGEGEPLTEDSPPMPVRKDTELVEMLQELLQKIQESTVPILEQLRKAVEEYTGLAADLRNPDGDLRKFLGNLNGIAEGLNEVQGTVGRLLKDPKTVDEVNAAIASVNTLVANLQSAVDSLNEAILDARAVVTNADSLLVGTDKAVSALPSAIRQAEDTLREVELLIEGIRKHWLLRKYMDESSGHVPLPAGAVAAPPARP